MPIQMIAIDADDELTPEQAAKLAQAVAYSDSVTDAFDRASVAPQMRLHALGMATISALRQCPLESRDDVLSRFIATLLYTGAKANALDGVPEPVEIDIPESATRH